MKKTIFPVLFTMLATGIFAQKKDDAFYIFKEDWSAADNINDCVYFMQPVKDNDSTFICRYYQKVGPLVRQESYLDADLTIPNGYFIWYNKGGTEDSAGYVKRGHKDGSWLLYNDSGSVQKEVIYDDGKLIKTINKREQKEYYPDGTVKEITQQTDTTAVKYVYAKAEYPGGINAWQKYLERNLHVPDRFNNLMHYGSCTVIVTFSIDKQGKVVDLQIGQSCEWSADAEALRVIKKGGDWLPASIDGRKVIYRQKQSLTFAINQ
ncbi:MAG TPA: energy transducer TonB [Chitinophagaceae bacterium]|nr:energy transducer TonB [Chitinophagaceae bacterium]